MDIAALFAAFSPVWLILTIVGGLLFGWVTKNLVMDRHTITTLLLVTLPFSISRLIVAIVFGIPVVTGGGWVGSTLFLVYLIAIYVGRKIANRDIKGG